jgi:hypothetical protein
VSKRDGVIYINGNRLVEPYIDPSLRGHETDRWQRVAPGHYSKLVDNRIHSCDSRTWETVLRGNLIGPVMLTYWRSAAVPSASSSASRSHRRSADRETSEACVQGVDDHIALPQQ